MRLLSLLSVCMLASSAWALPRGFTTFFNLESCPPGFHEIPESKGRVIVSVDDAKIAGLTVGEPLKDGEDPTHTHSTVGTYSVDSQHVAADGCCNTEGAHSGSYRASGTAVDHTSNLPFTQLLLCSSEDDSNYTVPYGTLLYYSPDVSSCPASFIGYSPAHGRAIIPGYDESGTVPSEAPPLASTEDRVHNHSTYGTFATSSVSYAGIDGCCNNDPARDGTYSIKGVSSAASANVPYLQLLTCLNKNESFDVSLPHGALLFSALLGCPDGWDIVSTVSGRFLVSLPYGGNAGLSFGGPSIPSSGAEPQHGHSVTGSVTLPSASVGLASGCCAGGYAATGTYPYEGATSQDTVSFPYLMVALCERATDKKKRV